MGNLLDKLKVCIKILRARKYAYAVETPRRRCEYGGAVITGRRLKPSVAFNQLRSGKIVLLNMARKLPGALDKLLSITPPDPPKKQSLHS